MIDSPCSNNILRKDLARFMSKFELHVLVSLRSAVSGGADIALSKCAC